MRIGEKSCDRSVIELEIGTHTFYAVKSGAPDRLTETGQFTHYWTENGQWKLSRVLSYDHVLAK